MSNRRLNLDHLLRQNLSKRLSEIEWYWNHKKASKNFKITQETKEATSSSPFPNRSRGSNTSKAKNCWTKSSAICFMSNLLQKAPHFPTLMISSKNLSSGQSQKPELWALPSNAKSAPILCNTAKNSMVNL